MSTDDAAGDRFTARLREAVAPIWQEQLEHPFVRGIGRGSLEEERFRRWVEQDYRYLEEFARIFGWAAAKADRLESMQWYASVLDLTLNTEMALHRRYARRFGISEEELEAVAMWPTTRAYTDFLVRTAADGDMAELVAALLPCAWGYAWIGRRLEEEGVPEDQRYADWVEQYASEEFQEASRWLQAEMERLASGRDEATLRRLEDLFVLSSRYEWRFWEMCWHGEDWKP